MGITILILGVFLVLGLFAAGLVLSILALVRTRGISDLKARLSFLERELRRLLWQDETVPAAVSPDAPPTRPGEGEEIPVVAVEDVGPEPAPEGAGFAREPPAPRPWFPWADYEAWIGRRGLGWAAVVLLLFAAAFSCADLPSSGKPQAPRYVVKRLS